MMDSRLKARVTIVLMAATELAVALASTDLSFIREGGAKGGALAQFVGGPSFKSVDIDSN